MANPFTDHPASVGENYFEHMGQAFSFAGAMFVGALACAVHGVLPFVCLKTGSTTVSRLHDRMVAHRVKPGHPAEPMQQPAE
ncbi:MAG: DUF6356 family protein [Alphaproteobacteria bacterium]